ncbi:hypothetical protein KP509_18G062100 [Ceratopteris richardii]|uniref:ADP,ATP carrier protein n=1 Tax=Ceratopteris richardii TaxID=49495 RepID=A0A8T2SS35_CERRI|nr:hypothetical protein KP509_18G062100 [Ceratopteris richardii]KAH7366073.1 hypothetical protein KP509_18G062100 [Ceratopteris richardii]KAH7366074.1 hypothetical protein KP509_18G062100 [Ceratopteris richardii]KAH7366075.1 hypothetical protein KP509_18G062100 [Ceratopteris richardii]
MTPSSLSSASATAASGCGGMLSLAFVGKSRSRNCSLVSARTLTCSVERSAFSSCRLPSVFDLHRTEKEGKQRHLASINITQGTALRGRRPSLISRPYPRGLIRAEAAADLTSGAPTNSSSSPSKFFGVETTTLKKVIPLGMMFFCILFNYTILRDTKDVLVVTAKGSSAEIIPFLKTWVNLPMAIGFMLIYTKLSNVLSKEALFYACIIPFIAFFGGFAFVLYPLKDVLHPTALADSLLKVLGPSFLGPVAILRIWTFCLFYVMAELWGSVVVSVLFWGFANQITTIDEAKQFYPLFGLGANIALVFSGRTVKYFSNMRRNLPAHVDGWGVSLKGMMSLVVALGLFICAVHWWVNRFVLNDPALPKAEARKKKEKPKLGMLESFKFLLGSRYIRDLATLVVAYGVSINLVEVTWKSKLKAQFPSPNDYSSFMGDFSSFTGIATFTMMLLSRIIFRKYGWGVAALITPSVLLITGVAFFALILCSEPLTPLLSSFGFTPLLAAVYVGAVQNIFSKSAKYSLFDPCKEMAYIPLDEDTKVKGKAAIDVVCNPLGKSGGALIQQFLIIGFGSLAASTPYLGGILLVIVLAWIAAARSLDRQFTPLVQEDLKSKLLEGKLSAMSAAVLGKYKRKPEVTYRFVSVLNEKGFIEGRYVPVIDGRPVASQVGESAVIDPALPDQTPTTKKTLGDSGDGAHRTDTVPSK